MIDWWTSQDAALIGSLGGAGAGVLGAIIGSAMGLCAPKGKCKGLVLGLMMFSVAVGVILLALGVVAIALGQPRHVWYPLLLIGAISAIVLGSLVPIAKRQYQLAEQRRIDAEHIRHG